MLLLQREKQVMLRLDRIIESLHKHVTTKVKTLESTACWMDVEKLQVLKVFTLIYFI
jgi:hypothetical protein